MTYRTGTRMIGIGIGFLVFGGFVLPVFLDMFDTTFLFLEYQESNHIIQIINTYGIGVVYVLFGLLLNIWGNLNQAKQIPFSVAVFTSGVAIIAIIGIWMFLLFPPGAPHQSAVFNSFLGNIRRTIFNPAVLIGYAFSWLIAYDFASALYQRILAIAGIVALPVTVLALNVRGFRVMYETNPGGLGLLLLGYILIWGIIILLAYIYGLPSYYLLKEVKQ